MSRRRRNLQQSMDLQGVNVGEVKVEVEDESNVTVKERKGRGTRSKPAIKIEVEPEEEDNGESKYFSKVEEKVSVVKEEKRDESFEDVSLEANKLTKSKSKSSPSPSKKVKRENVKVEPPENWVQMLENIKVMRSDKTAAVDTMGCERTADLKQEPQVQRFQTLVSLILSSQTKDQVTFAAVERLKEKGLTVQRMIDIDEGELAQLLNPVGFYRRKATYIKKVAQILRDEYNNDIPKSIEDLCALPGVGPKMAYICMNAAWHENVGIGVDTHVHRISNRLKWTGSKETSTPEKTREALESWLPKEMWQEINVLLVGFGQQICLPIGPKCKTCLNKDICPSAEIDRKSKKK